MVELTYKQICRQVAFPVFVMPSDELYYEDGLLTYNDKVIDDRNQEGDTLGVRRLKSPHKLYKLGKTVIDFIGLINCNELKFIDSKGRVFIYVKTKMCPVKSFKINRAVSKGFYTVLWFKRINFPFTIDQYPLGKEWGQIIMLDGLPWKLFSVSESPLQDFARKI